MDKDWEQVEVYSDAASANIVAGLLQSESIATRIVAREPVPGLSEGYSLQVPTAMLQRAREVLTQLVGGLQSGMSYSGVHTLKELQEKAVFVRMTGAGLRESGPHDVEVIG